MNFPFLLGFFLFFAAEPGARDLTWFTNQGNLAADKAQKPATRAEALQILDEMRQEADRQKNEEKRLYTQMCLGQCQFYFGDLSQSIKLLREVEDKADSARFRHLVLRDLGDAYLESGKFSEAETYFKKAIDEGGAAKYWRFGAANSINNELKYVQSMVGLRKMVEAKKALPAVRARIKKEVEPKELMTILDARWEMLHATIDLDGRNVVGALVRLDRSQKALQGVNNAEAVDLRYKCHVNLASFYWLLARFDDADAQLGHAAKLLPSVRTERNEASLKNARAGLLIERTAIAIEDDPESPRILGDLNLAESNLRDAQAHHAKACKGEDLITATIDFQLAQIHDLRGRALQVRKQPDDAKAEFQKGKGRCDVALKWAESAYSPEHDLVLEMRNRRAWLNIRLGDLKSARQESEKALELFQKTHDKTHMDQARYVHALIEVESRSNNAAKAAEYANDHRRQVDAGLGSVLAGLSATEQIQFFRKWDHPGLRSSLRLSIQNPDDQSLAEQTAVWLINGKAKLTEMLGEQIRTARAGKQEAFARYQASIQRQAYLLYGPTTDEKIVQTSFLIEEAAKRDLVEDAAREARAKPPWYTLDQVRASLDADEVYVGVFAMRTDETATRAYHAWIVPHKGPVSIVKLGDAGRIEHLVWYFLREQQKVPLIAPGEEKWAEEELRNGCLCELSALVLTPIYKKAGTRSRWVVSPDGPLWNVPWAAMLLPGSDRYAIEELTFRYAVSGQDLVRDKEQRDVGEPVIMGDPNFNFTFHQATSDKNFRPWGDPLKIPFERLQFSRLETDVMNTIMQAASMKPVRFPSEEMRKEQLFVLKKAPRMVYLSTHAYAHLPSRVHVDDPLLSCALACAGWNYLPEPRADVPQSLPGMMTGAEIMAIDLRGTELVVIASCQTGAELLAPGHSPASLRHAFHIAGARSVVSALWTMNDRTTLEVMEPFMAEACKPGSKVNALRSAQRQSMRYLEMYREHTHPYYWAGFTLSGG